MNIPTIFDWLAYFSFLRDYTAAWIILGTGILIVLYLDWRLSLFALILQYLIASLLFFDLLTPQLAIIKLFVGMFVCLILYWTARQVSDARARFADFGLAATKQKLRLGSLEISRDLAVRLSAILAALLIVAILEWGFSFYLPGLPDDLGYINLAILLLIALGLAGVVANRDPLAAGMGVLTFMTGFELFYAAIDQTTRSLALLAVLNFTVAIATSYLAQRQVTKVTAAVNHD